MTVLYAAGSPSASLGEAHFQEAVEACLAEAGQREALQADLGRGRLAGLPLVVLDPEGAGDAEAVAAWRGSRPLLVLDAPVAVDPAFLESLLEAWEASGGEAHMCRFGPFSGPGLPNHCMRRGPRACSS